MRRALIIFTLFAGSVLLRAQDVSPVIVETLPPTPTVVITGEPFTVTYEVNYLNLTGGKEIIILTDELAPDKVAAAPFEVLRLDKGKKRLVGNAWMQDFTFTMRIIDSQKGDLKIPKIRFPWIIVDAAHGKDKRGDANSSESAEIPIRYISTIIKNSAYDIRDGAHFGKIPDARLLRIGAGLLVLAFGAWILLSFAKLRRNRNKTPIEGTVRGAVPSGYALFRERIGALGKLQRGFAAMKTENPERAAEIEEKFFGAIRLLLSLELSHAVSSLTPRELSREVDALKDGGKKRLLKRLAGMLLRYETDIDAGTLALPADLGSELKELRSISRRLWLRRLIS